MANRSLKGVFRTPHMEPNVFFIKVPIDGASAVGTIGPTGISSYVTVTKPAGTGVYRVTLSDIYQEVVWCDATILKAAGTLDADILPVTESGFQSSGNYVEFQVKKSSDGTALDPTSVTIRIMLVLRNSQVTP
ncbi:MAG: hypothetical protein V4529_16440 [Gemmatimonadota bacterium]